MISARRNGGEEAMALAAQVACDVAVLDIDMPRRNGLITAQKLRAAHFGISAILPTSHGRPGRDPCP